MTAAAQRRRDRIIDAVASLDMATLANVPRLRLDELQPAIRQTQRDPADVRHAFYAHASRVVVPERLRHVIELATYQPILPGLEAAP